MAEHGALILDGAPLTAEELAELTTLDVVVAADGAARQLMEAGLAPDWIVGDLDSLTEAEVEEAQAQGARIARHPTDKATTDGALARAKLESLQPDQVTVYGATGGRLAMTLANLNDLVALATAGLPTTIAAGRQRLSFHEPGQTVTIDQPPGTVFNVLAWQGAATVSIQGARYEAHELRLAPEATTGVSNECLDGAVTVQVHDGLVLLIVEHL